MTAEILEISDLVEPSGMKPRVIVYSSDEAVPAQRFVAYVTVPTKEQKTGVLSERRLGISFPAADDGTARSAAHRWWQAQREREAAREEAAAERGRKLEADRLAKAAKPVAVTA